LIGQSKDGPMRRCSVTRPYGIIEDLALKVSPRSLSNTSYWSKNGLTKPAVPSPGQIRLVAQRAAVYPESRRMQASKVRIPIISGWWQTHFGREAWDWNGGSPVGFVQGVNPKLRRSGRPSSSGSFIRKYGTL